MDPKERFILLALCLIYASVGASADWRRYWIGSHNRGGVCFVDPKRVPGDSEIVLKSVKAPAVKLQETSLSVLAFSDPVYDFAGDAVEILDKIAAVASVHPAVDKGIAALGLVYQLASGKRPENPTVEDLQKATKEAFDELAKDTDLALKGLKDYVDNEFLEFEKRLMKNEYATLYQGWANCEDYKNKADLDRCLKNQIDAMRREKPKFLKYNDKIGSIMWNPTVKQLKQVQAGMFLFRDYEQLMLMALQTMVNYEGDSGTQFKGMLDEEIEDAIKYANAAVDKIKELHGDPISSNACADTIECVNVGSGWPITGTCSCKLDLALGDSQACRADFTLHPDGMSPEGTFFELYAPADGNAVKMLENAVVQWNTEKRNRQMNDYFGQELYQLYMAKTLKKYWDNQILSLIPTWEAMRKANRKRQVMADLMRRDAMREDMRARRISFIEYLLDQVQPRDMGDWEAPYGRM